MLQKQFKLNLTMAAAVSLGLSVSTGDRKYLQYMYGSMLCEVPLCDVEDGFTTAKQKVKRCGIGWAA